MVRPGNVSSKSNSKQATVKGVRAKRGKVNKKEVKKNGSDFQSRGQSQSCHQCRQSIHSSKGVSEVKKGKARLKCSTCTRFWCEQCLFNRYGVIKDETDSTTWSCPVCQKKCNCSLCRRKEGKLATGILTPLVKNSGFENVSDFLDKGTNDIAKVLQWSSPATGVGNRRDIKHSEHSPSKSTKQKRKLSMNSHSKKLNKSKSYSQENNPTQRRRKVAHPQYNITMEENLECCQEVSLSTAANSGHFPNSSDTNSTSPFYPDQLHVPCRRSARKRIQSQFYTAKDFRKDSPDSTSHHCTTICFQSPPCSFISPDSSSSILEQEEKVDNEGIAEKKQLLIELRKQQIESINQKKKDYEISIKDEKEKLKTEKRAQILQQRASEKEQKAQERKKLMAEKKHSCEELKLSKIRAREKFKLIQSVKRQALKEMKQLQKEKERATKQDLLRKLKEKKKEENRQKLQLATTPLCLEKFKMTMTLVDDSLEECEAAGLPDLPSFPLLILPHVPNSLIPSVLFASEFIHTFSHPLGLQKKMSVSELCTAIASGRGLSDVYFALLKTVVDKEKLKKDMKASRRQRHLERLARVYLAENINQGFGSSPETEVPTVEESMQLLDHLSHRALCSPTITDYLDSTKELYEQLRREHKTKERGVSRMIGDSLKKLCEEGASLIEIEKKREEFLQELKQLQETFKEELADCSVLGQKNFLGMDRHNRLYWMLQSYPAVVVEEKIPEQNEPCWTVVDNHLLLEELLECLHPYGHREKPLHNALLSVRDSIFK